MSQLRMAKDLLKKTKKKMKRAQRYSSEWDDGFSDSSDNSDGCY